MKYRVVRTAPQTLTLSEYCTQRGYEIVVRQAGICWYASLVINEKSVYSAAAMSTIDKAIEQLCGQISRQSLVVVVIPGTDLEAENQVFSGDTPVVNSTKGRIR